MKLCSSGIAWLWRERCRKAIGVWLLKHGKECQQDPLLTVTGPPLIPALKIPQKKSWFIPFLLILVHYHFPSLHFVGHCLESQPRRQERTTTTSLLSQSVAPPFSWAFLQNSTHWNALAIWVDVRDIGGLVGILSWICRGSLRLSSAPEDQLGIVKTKRSYDCTTLFPTEACASISKTYAIKICTCPQKWKALILWTSKRVQEEAMPPFKNAPAHKKEKH